MECPSAVRWVTASSRFGVPRLEESVQGRIARVLFSRDRLHRMVLLHAFVKKTQRTPPEDLELARQNKRKHERSLL